MELRQLEYFVAVAEEASFTKAAARCFVAQPGVSAQVRRLERELGLDLLDRRGRTVRLTSAGEAVLPYARQALDGVAKLRHTVDEFTGVVRGRVAMGMVRAGLTLEGLPSMLADFHKSYPGVEISLSEDNTENLVDSVADGRLDIALAALTGDTPEGIEVDVLFDEEIVLAVSPSDQLADRRFISIDELRDRPLICLPRGSGIRACLEQECESAGFQPKVTIEVSNLPMLADLAAREFAPAILPVSMIDEYPDTLRAVRFADPGIRGRMGLIWRSVGPISPAARVFVRYARQAFPAGESLAEPTNG
ncbi:LysR family transcriptional regulator [Pseudonocardiaceae bacterium YIM PH 21723]|nr:LysR family transcriptional regulator [Pseudonocardiaceae bacterium YIM PH 21723]